MRVRSITKERLFYCNMGHLKVCDTVRQLVDIGDNVMMEEVVRTEFQADWLNETMANELWEWKKSGFTGPAPIWAA